MYYSAIGLLAILVLLIENHDILLRRGNVRTAERLYRRFLVSVLLYFILDVLWGVLSAAGLAAVLRAYLLGDEKEAARRELAEAAKIAELRQSISSLLDNMPGLSFSKDAQSGVYLACNQAFARYAHKDSPSGVVGLTDAQIFDAETARHFVEDDKMALSMDEPYIFFEDVPDAAAAIRALAREDAKRIPIIALTANAFDEDVQRSMQAGMNAHLTKPVESERLIQTLGELVWEAEEERG